MAFTPVTGTSGRVKSGSNIVAGITSWSLTETTGQVNLTHFESAANADGTVYATKLPGIAEWTVDVEGIFDTATLTNTETGSTGFRNGILVTLDLVADKTNSLGYDNIAGYVGNLQRGVQINNTAFTFKMQVFGTGAPPNFGSIT